jgi:L-lactate dehydrogenase complex protein LldF
MIPRTKEFKKELPKHLRNDTVRRNISKALDLSISKRNAAVAEVPDWEELREKANHIRRQIIDNLYDNLNVFEKNARKNGVKVFRAAGASEANSIAEEIAKNHAVKSIVKSKSMVSEEIGFNDYMIAKGFEVVETDLGEFIIQLANETPSHLIGPAIHKSIPEIAQLFSEKLGVPYSEDPLVLTETARKILREKFLNADMGVTGANFGIVENGGIIIVENEGNGRMCSTLPKIHLALIGMERLIPGVNDLALFLTLLCRSATGQRLSSYVSMLTGPKPAESFDGAERSYYIIIDNKRSSFLRDDNLKQALYCIRCSACYNVCPVYQNIGGHAYGWVYQGPIGAVITPQFLGLENARDLPFASSLCGSCTDVCPVKIPLHRLLWYQRSRIVKELKSSKFERMIFRGFNKIAQSSRIFHKMGKIARMIQKVIPGNLYSRGWTASRKFPGIAKTSFHDWWTTKSRREKQP